MKIRIATRESRLALWQAEHVRSRLQALGHAVELLPMTTRGDQILDRTLSKVGGKGLFVKELELALLDGCADIAVHSLKDVPMDLGGEQASDFALACVMAREDPRDALVSKLVNSLAELPVGSVVGTSSLRRMVLLQALRPDLKIEPLRGNLDTRLRKLDEGQYAAIVLAAAGLKRLGLGHRIANIFEPAQMLPAAGQGALGIETLTKRVDLQAALAPLAHQSTWLAVAAERQVSRALGGSCSMPLAAFAQWQEESGRAANDTEEGSSGDSLGDNAQALVRDVVGNLVGGVTSGPVLHLEAAWGDPAQAGLVRAQGAAPVSNLAQASALGAQVAQLLRTRGARLLA